MHKRSGVNRYQIASGSATGLHIGIGRSPCPLGVGGGAVEGIP